MKNTSTCGKALLAVMTGIVLIGAAHADTKKMRIAFSNNYAGNSWRQAMLKSYDIVTKKAVADGIVAAADVFTTADKEVPTQAAQIQNLILQGYNAIVINAASPDALNGAIKQACDAGIVVVSFDGIVTEPCAYRVVVDFKAMGKEEVTQMAAFQPKGGNLLEIRGLAGTSIDDAIHAGILEGVAAHPEFKIVGSVTGGPPFSTHCRVSASGPNCQSKLTLPPGDDNAPCFAALVASSCSASASPCAVAGWSEMSGPQHWILSPAR